MHLHFLVCVLLGGAVPNEDHMVLSTEPSKTGSFSANRNASFKQFVPTAAYEDFLNECCGIVAESWKSNNGIVSDVQMPTYLLMHIAHKLAYTIWQSAVPIWLAGIYVI